MTPDELLRMLYLREKPLLQTNDWRQLRIPVADLIAAVCPPANPADVIDLLRTLRMQGRVMFLPDWNRWGTEEDETDGTLIPSPAQWEPLPGNPDPPSWRPREVFQPEDLRHWFVRSRMAETARLLSTNRERFGLGASTAHLGYELQPRSRPDRTTAAVSTVVTRLKKLIDDGELARATNPIALKLALEVVGAGLGLSHIAAFQERAWESILRSLFAKPRAVDATMITAGVSSGKTFAFVLPTLTLLVYRVLCGEGGRNRALIIYPRTSLVEDQYHRLRDLLAQVNTQLKLHRPGVSLTDRPALDAGQLLAQSLDLEPTSLAEALAALEHQGIEIILTTPESLKNRMLDPRAVRTYLSDVEVVVLDEIHLLEGLAGCHGIYFIRRLRQLLRDLHQDPKFEPAWVGASATVAEPVEHCARVLSLDDAARITHIAPSESELVPFGTFHHLFLHTQVGKPSVSAVTNGIACLVHTRNDGTAFNHYVDPSAAVLQRRPSEEIPKTLAFIDSLSTIGRLRFTTADNERTYEPFERAPPYYSWFFRPAARLAATAGEVKSIGEQRLAAVRSWCQKCYSGVPARIDSAVLQAPEFTYLRTNLKMGDDARRRATPPGFPEMLASLSGPVENLDECPFHQARLCWWFSQDNGARRTLGNGQVPLDQNRALAYTSRTDEPVRVLHDNVNDYFLTPARKLWERADGIPAGEEAVSMLFASPRIEVGVDFSNVRDGVTHKAMRSAASFQQKVGRVGREDDSDSLIVTFLARRPTDSHFAHNPARLIDARHLDPIPLKSENPDVLRNHLFAAGLEFLASRAPGDLPDAGHELDIIGTGSAQIPDRWEDKVQACIGYLGANRAAVRSFMLAATKQRPAHAHFVDEAIDSLLVLLNLFVTDLSGAYFAGVTAAHLFMENHPPTPAPAFVDLLIRLSETVEALQSARIVSPALLQAPIDAMLTVVTAPSPTAAGLLLTANNLMAATVTGVTTGLDPGVAAVLFGAVAKAQACAATLGSLVLAAPLAQVRKAYAIVQAFFEQPDPGTRVREQYYLHDILVRLRPFRDFYPFGLVRTHFQHVNARHVQIQLPDNDLDSEPLATALYELLPGTWNYRWVRPYKSRSGPINQLGQTGEYFVNLSLLEGPNRSAFVETEGALTAGELPEDMPAVPTGTTVTILQPTRLLMDRAYNRPEARFDSRLIEDGDEAPRSNDPDSKQTCPTLPRAFPASWYRVNPGPQRQPIVGQADPNNPHSPVPHTYPAIGRVLFEGVDFSAELATDRYVYAIDRSYGNSIQGPRIYYRYGPTLLPVVLGERLSKTDGLIFRLKGVVLDTLISAQLAAAGPVRGEVTIRALRRFIASESACGPFQAEMIRKVILMQHLNAGGTLTTLDASAVRGSLAAITRARYDQICADILDGVFAGVAAAEAGAVRPRQVQWYADAWPAFQTVQAAAARFTPKFVAAVAKNILVHTLAVTTLDALCRLVGASDGDLTYFHRPDANEFYVFDSVEGGNGYAETIARFLQIPPLRRILAARGEDAGTLPNLDGFMLIEEALASCPAQSATRLLVETCRHGVPDPARLRFPRGLVADLQARIRHEYDPVTGARAIVEHLLSNEPAVFADWSDLLWLQVLPERFATRLAAAGVCPNLESLSARTHLCVSGCLECVDAADQSIYGSLASREYVSKNLLDAVRRHIVTSEPQAFVQIPAGTPVGAALQANAGRPVTDDAGAPVTVVIDDGGGPRQVLLTQIRSTVLPDLSIGGGLLLTPTTGGAWEVQLPFLASYRDERPSA
jgi:hypothetical protein